MEKIAVLNQEDDNTFEIIKHVNDKFRYALNDVIEKSVTMYLGQPFNPYTDAERVSLKIYPDKTELWIDGKSIGVIKQVMNYNCDDFVQNKVSFLTSFTPTVF